MVSIFSTPTSSSRYSPASLGSKLQSAAPGRIFLSSIVLGELYFGAANSSRPEANTEALDVCTKTCNEVPVDSLTAKAYAAIRLKLKKRGRPIPENDIWLAACALQHRIVLVTRDRHFESVDAIEIVEW